MTGRHEARPGAADRTAQVLESMPVGYLSVDAAGRTTYANAEAEQLLGRTRAQLVGGPVRELFPRTVGTDVEAGYRRAVETGRPVVVDAWYPEPLNAWYEVRVTPEGDGVALYFLDTTTRRRGEQARDEAAQRLAGLSRFALALTSITAVEDMITAITERGLPLLGCSGGSLAFDDPDDPEALRSYVTASYGTRVQTEYAQLARAARLPVAEVMRTGRAILLPDRATATAYSSELAEVVELTGSQAWASLPLPLGAATVGVVTAGWAEPQAFDADQVALLETFAAQCAQALDRLQALEAERAAARRVARMGEALQRSLLTELPAPDHLELVARYLPAADEAQVGGDWYDAFLVRDGATCLVIGDVTGHDQSAAVQMAQVRNVLRGISHCLVDPPAEILHALDWAMHDLAVGSMATAVFAKIEQVPSEAAEGLRTLRWSNAGHLPPLLIEAGGRSRYLQHQPDLLLGLHVDTERQDHTHTLEPGSTVLLFTDGLVERRGENLDDGLQELLELTSTLGHLRLQELCDAVVAHFGRSAEDDIALLAVRAHPEDRPRPPEAGPGRLPDDLLRDAPAAL